MASSYDLQDEPRPPLAIGEAARILGVSVETLRRWDRQGKLTSQRTIGQQRRFDAAQIEALATGNNAA